MDVSLWIPILLFHIFFYRVPPQPLSSKILKFTIKASLLGATIYMGYKIIPLPSSNALQSIKSSFEGLLEVSAK